MNLDSVGKHTNPDLLTPDAGPDTSDADYHYQQQPDRNDAAHESENVDFPDTDTTSEEENLADRQLRHIGRMAG